MARESTIFKRDGGAFSSGNSTLMQRERVKKQSKNKKSEGKVGWESRSGTSQAASQAASSPAASQLTGLAASQAASSIQPAAQQRASQQPSSQPARASEQASHLAVSQQPSGEPRSQLAGKREKEEEPCSKFVRKLGPREPWLRWLSG